MHAFGTKELVGLVGISRSRIRALIRAGHVRPGRGRRGELRFSFQDLIILRTAKALAAASVPVRRINQSLRQLQASLPPEVPLSGLSITSIGDRIAVREGFQQREIESGQYVLALNVVTEGGKVKIIDHSARAAAPPAPGTGSTEEHGEAEDDRGEDGDEHFLAAASLEDENPEAAIAAYARCLAACPDHYEASLNLGRLLHLAGRLKDAERVYRDARRQGDGPQSAQAAQAGCKNRLRAQDLARVRACRPRGRQM